MTREATMPWVKPQYLWEDTDRHGNVRLYVAKPDQKKIRIRAEPDTKEFWTAYAAALEGKSIAKPAPTAPLAPAPVEGTFAWLVEKWKVSTEFLELDAATRRARTNLLEACCAEPIKPDSPHIFGGTPLGKVTPSAIRMLRDRKRDVPDGANNRLKALRVIFKWALEQDDIGPRYGFALNPARDVSRLPSHNKNGFHTWTVEEVEQYERRHPIGTTARLALALFLFTGQRKSDVVQFGRQHRKQVRDPETNANAPWFIFTQHKNRKNKPVKLELPVLAILDAILGESPCGNLTYLVTPTGKPYSVAGFGNRMRKWCNQAGLSHCSAHGLRKAGACIMAENGATDAQMMAIFGWSDPAMPAKYRKMARQRKLAGENMRLLVRKGSEKPAPAALPLFDLLDAEAGTDGAQILPPAAGLNKSGSAR